MTNIEQIKQEQERVLALISAAQEAQEEFERTGTREAELRAYTFRQDIDRESLTLARQYAALLAAHAEALARDRWIPVEERLPEEGVWVLVATHEVNSLGYFRYAQMAYLLGGEWHQVNGSVSHWQPLPAPPAPASAGGAE